MIVGFTGTRHGTDEAQRWSLASLLTTKLVDATAFHHGCCLGADAEAHWMVRDYLEGADIIAHPGKGVNGKQEWLDEGCLADADRVEDTKTHFARNRDIVDAAAVVVGCPGVMAWQHFGGTFYTLDWALKRGKPVIVVWPGGRVEHRGASL